MTDATFPKRFRVDLLPSAAADVADILAYFKEVDPAYGASLVGHLLDAADSLQVLPYRFRVYRPNSRPVRVVRVMPGPSP